MDALVQHLPQDAVGFLVTVMMSLLIGFEREINRADIFFFGGVRTFPLLGLGGYLLVLAFPDSVLPFSAGLLVVGALLAISFHVSADSGDTGLTTELAAVLTYGLGAAAGLGHYWLAIATGVVTLMLLQEKQRLHSLVEHIPRAELVTAVRFLLLSGVILPVVPNRGFGAFEVNPFKLWLVVVAVCAVSYLSYLLQLRWPRGLILAGILGGAYSSTVTTVVLARRSKDGQHSPIEYAGAITAATAVMYIRLWILIRLFAPPLAGRLTWVFWPVGVAGLLLAGALSRIPGSRKTPSANDEPAAKRPSNPLDLGSAFTFAGLFVVILVTTRIVAERFGDTGLLLMAAIMGAGDVDPFILGLTQYVGHGLDLGTAAAAVVIAAGTNNLMKGVYACIFGNRRTGLLALATLVGLALASGGMIVALR